MKNLWHKIKQVWAKHPDTCIIIVLFTLARGLMLFNNGLYWDDWTTYKVDRSFIWQHFREAGIPLKGLIHILLRDCPIAYRWVVFFSFLASAFLLNKVLKGIKELPATDRLFVILFFVLLPYNHAMISTNIAPQMVCHLLFFVGVFFLNRFILEKKWSDQAVSLIAFLFSFQLLSFVIFYFSIFILIAYHEKIFPKLTGSWKRLQKYTAFGILPFFYYFGIKKIFLEPTGIFEGYHNMPAKNFSIYHYNMVDSLRVNFIAPIQEIFKADHSGIVNYYYYFIIAIVIAYSLLRRRDIEEQKYIGRFLGAGWLMYLFGIIPYMLGKDNYLAAGWYTRYQVHLSLGAAFMLYFSLKWVFQEFKLNKRLFSFILSVLVAGFLVSNILNCFYFQRDWVKKLALIEHFRYNQAIINNTTFLIVDETSGTNVLGENYRGYEYTGVLNKTFDYDQKRAAIVSGGWELGPLVLEEHVQAFKDNRVQLNLRNYEMKPPVQIFIAEQKAITFPRAYMILLCEIFSKKNYTERLTSFFDVEVKPLR